MSKLFMHKFGLANCSALHPYSELFRAMGKDGAHSPLQAAFNFKKFRTEKFTAAEAYGKSLSSDVIDQFNPSRISENAKSMTQAQEAAKVEAKKDKAEQVCML